VLKLRPGTAFLFLLLALAGCASMGGGAAIPLASTEFSPALGVDLSIMTETPSGLHFRDVTPGSGEMAQAGNRLGIRYIAWLPSGRQIDDNITAAAPLEFRLGDPALIRGWNEGLEGMRSGGQRMLVVPPSLAYGRWGRGRVPPNSTLIFLVELVTVE
jgi:FKBP-type peptidyl-prolyl cis-trans isomerase